MFNSYKEETHTENDLRKIYIENYGVKMEFPAYYIQDAKFVPHEPDLIVQMAQHIIPKVFTHTVQTTWINGDVQENEF